VIKWSSLLDCLRCLEDRRFESNRQVPSIFNFEAGSLRFQEGDGKPRKKEMEARVYWTLCFQVENRKSVYVIFITVSEMNKNP
jgi:hypothetical protein